MIYDRFSPWYNPDHFAKPTGTAHDWQKYDGTYYGPAYQCSRCKKKNTGWNLWEEDFLLTCVGNEEKDGS